ncbi:MULTISPECIES: oligosaccharide flippase family protein [unclassified Shewanella]|uniref:oligosaccharide flippase family protein n=1 Tax=unclassified Shewanella TaxID=196818 RepID=UPI00354F5CD6
MINLLKGSSYFALSSYIVVIFSALVTIVNGKILTAEDFGLIAISMLFTSMLESLKQLGFKEYLISQSILPNQNLQEQVAWTLDFIKGIVLCIISLVSIPYLVSAYNEPRLELMIVIISVSFIFESIASPKLYLARKNLEYKVTVKISFFSSLIYCISSILLVLHFKSYLGVIYGLLIRSLASSFLSYFFYSVKPNFTFNKDVALKQFRYGKWILASGIVFYFTNRFDNLVLSINVSLEELGYYGFAYSVVNGVLGGPIKSINSALFPILSKGGHGLRKKQVVACLFLVGIILAILMYYTLPFIVVEFIGAKWDSSTSIISILAIAFCVNGIKVDGYFLANKKPNYKFIVEVVRGAVIIFLCIPMVNQYGGIGAAWSLLIANIFSLFVWLYMIRTLDEINME